MRPFLFFFLSLLLLPSFFVGFLHLPLFFFAKSAFFHFLRPIHVFSPLFQSLIFLPLHISPLVPPFENICPGPVLSLAWLDRLIRPAKAFLDCVLGRPVRFFSTPPEMKCHAVDERCLRAHSLYGRPPARSVIQEKKGRKRKKKRKRMRWPNRREKKKKKKRYTIEKSSTGRRIDRKSNCAQHGGSTRRPVTRPRTAPRAKTGVMPTLWRHVSSQTSKVQRGKDILI